MVRWNNAAKIDEENEIKVNFSGLEYKLYDRI